jgi:hypothetical protein
VKETDALSSRKKERHEQVWKAPTEYAARELQFQAPDDPKEFSGQRVAKCTSFNEVQPARYDFTLAWSKSEAKKKAAWRARWLGICVDLNDDEAGTS